MGRNSMIRLLGRGESATERVLGLLGLQVGGRMKSRVLGMPMVKWKISKKETDRTNER